MSMLEKEGGQNKQLIYTQIYWSVTLNLKPEWKLHVYCYENSLDY